MIRIENLQLKYGDHEVFRNLNATIEDGEVVGVIGASGSGKSRLLRCILDLEKPTGGRILFNGEDMAAANADEIHKRIGMVFQNFNLFSHMSVIENVMCGQVDLQNVTKEEAFSRATKLLQSVGLSDKAYFYPAKLSGGQQQRAAIARTLAMEPELILMDEPTSALDPMTRGEVEAVIRMVAAQGHTMVIATNEMELIRQVCSRVLFLYDGVVYEEGTPEEIFDHPKNTQTRRFVRGLRVLEFDVESKNFDFIGNQTTIAEFAYRNAIPAKLVNRLQSVMEELFQMVIIQPEEQHKMHIGVEYSNQEESLAGSVLFSGPVIDPDDPMFFFSWPIIVKRCSEVTTEAVDEDGYTNRVTMKIK